MTDEEGIWVASLIDYPVWAFLIGGGLINAFEVSPSRGKKAAYLVALLGYCFSPSARSSDSCALLDELKADPQSDFNVVTAIFRIEGYPGKIGELGIGGPEKTIS